jgi:hypothetical protein
MSQNDVGPHEFADGRNARDRVPGRPAFCERCYEEPEHHPIRLWAEARPYGDRTVRPPAYAPFRRA